MKKICYICGSDQFIDWHHYDRQEGRYSPETVQLCRRCHRTYHDFGIGSFSPDTTEKALEVENKRREIYAMPPMKPEEIRHSDYWYKKHNITRPGFGKKKSPKGIIPFRIPQNPLCGDDWLRTHLTDYTPEEIGALTIEIDHGGKRLLTTSLVDKRGTVKKILRQRSYRER